MKKPSDKSKPAKQRREEVAQPVGRPSDYNNEIAIIICDRIIEGESLRSITRDDAMPSIKTVYSWIKLFPEFLKQYELAKADQIDTFADEMLDIADDGTNDYITRTNSNGDESEVTNSENIQRSRLRVDTRKWIAERMKPRKYGPKQDINLGGQPDNPFQVQEVEAMTVEEQLRVLNEKLHRGKTK